MKERRDLRRIAEVYSSMESGGSYWVWEENHEMGKRESRTWEQKKTRGKKELDPEESGAIPPREGTRKLLDSQFRGRGGGPMKVGRVWKKKRRTDIGGGGRQKNGCGGVGKRRWNTPLVRNRIRSQVPHSGERITAL